MRPTYETAAHRADEARVAAALQDAWGVTLAKLKPYYGLDMAILVDGKMKGVAEIKCRSYSSQQIDNWGGLILSAHKVMLAQQWHANQRMAVVLAVGLTDGIYALAIAPEDPWPVFEITLAGRTDRGDAADIEPCCLIPISLMTRIT